MAVYEPDQEALGLLDPRPQNLTVLGSLFLYILLDCCELPASIFTCCISLLGFLLILEGVQVSTDLGEGMRLSDACHQSLQALQQR